MKFLPGDIIAFYGTGRTSVAIRLGTCSPVAPKRLRFGPSHVGIVCNPWADDSRPCFQGYDKPVLIESTSLARTPPLFPPGKPCQGVQAHIPSHRIEEYLDSGGYADLYRLSPIDRFSSEESLLLSRILIKHFLYMRSAYDTGGALLSGTRVLKLTRLLPASALETVFCSELIAAVLQRLSRMNRTNPTKHNPSSLLRTLVWQGTYQFDTRWEGD